MFWFKHCPRCSGDLFKDNDQYGEFITCMQCGFNRDLPVSHQGLLIISADPLPAPVVPESDGTKRRRISHGGRHFAKTVTFDVDEMTPSAA